MKMLCKTVIILLVIVIPSACDNEEEGCCVGCCDTRNLRDGLPEYYCYNGWTKSDCDRFQRDNVNGVNWTFHADKNCSDLGFQVTN